MVERDGSEGFAILFPMMWQPAELCKFARGTGNKSDGDASSLPLR